VDGREAGMRAKQDLRIRQDTLMKQETHGTRGSVGALAPELDGRPAPAPEIREESSQAAIRVEGLWKRYRIRGKEVDALAGVDLSIAAGEFVAVVGASGSGKSTLLLAVGGLVHPDAGEVYLEGRPLYDMGAAGRAKIRRQTVGFLFQTFHLVPYLTALENVKVPLYVAGKPPGEQAEIAARLLDDVGLRDRSDHKPSELSVGQQQRVALARALANSPRIILADEPTGSLDPDLAKEMVSHLARLNAEGITVVMVTHDPAVAARARRQVRLAEGRIVEGAC
jgi:putative ABC transport system ATP-binding protein